MKAHLYLPITLLSIATLTSCTDTCKKPAEQATQEEVPAQSTSSAQETTATRTVMGGKVIHFEDLVTRGGSANDVLNQTLKDNSKVVLDFYAEWCGPCKKLGPVLDKLASKYPDVLFVKINVDQYGSLSDKFGVKGIPALFFFKNGERVGKASGFKSESDMKELLSKLS